MALPDRSDTRLLPVASGKVRARKADLADRNCGSSVRREPVGRDLSGYIQIPRSARPPRKGRRSDSDAQYAGGNRLPAARRENAGTQTKLLERVAMAIVDGKGCPRPGGARTGRAPCLCPLPTRQVRWR